MNYCRDCKLYSPVHQDCPHKNYLGSHPACKKFICEKCNNTGVYETPPDQTGVFKLKCKCRKAGEK